MTAFPSFYFLNTLQHTLVSIFQFQNDIPCPVDGTLVPELLLFFGQFHPTVKLLMSLVDGFGPYLGYICEGF